MAKGREKPGPRGGTTTRKSGQVRKTFWLNDDEAEALRRAAFEENRPEASIVREMFRDYFELD